MGKERKPPECQFAILPGRALRALFSREIDRDDLVLIAVLAGYANKDGWCFPSQALIGEGLGRHITWVSRRLSKLKEKGIVESMPLPSNHSQARLDGGNPVLLYRIIYDSKKSHMGKNE